MPERSSPRVGDPPNTPFAPPPKIRDLTDAGSGTGIALAQVPPAAKAPAGELLDAFASPKASSGFLAKRYSGLDLPVQVLRSGAGYYLGTIDEDGPCSRESQEYFPTKESAEEALQTGRWTQRERP